MDQKIKAGKVLQNVMDHFQNKEFTSEQLKEVLTKELEIELNDLKFVNCSGEEFNFPDLLDFLVYKGKLLKKEDQYNLNSEFVCSCD